MATVQEIKAFMDSAFPNNKLMIESVGNKHAVIRSSVAKSDLRPGNTVSGPFMMTLVDTALYVAIHGELGLVALAVTSSININFLRKPNGNCDVIAKCNLIKVGKKLVVGEVYLYSDGEEEPIAHAVGTYSLPGTRPE